MSYEEEARKAPGWAWPPLEEEDDDGEEEEQGACVFNVLTEQPRLLPLKRQEDAYHACVCAQVMCDDLLRALSSSVVKCSHRYIRQRYTFRTW